MNPFSLFRSLSTSVHNTSGLCQARQYTLLARVTRTHLPLVIKQLYTPVHQQGTPPLCCDVAAATAVTATVAMTLKLMMLDPEWI